MTFSPKDVQRYFYKNRFDRLDKIFAAVEVCAQKDMWIIENWEQYYRELRIPFAVTQNKRYWHIWKEKLV